MKYKSYLLSLRVITLFVVAMISSFIPEKFPEFFDVKCSGTVSTRPTIYSAMEHQCSEMSYDSPVPHKPKYHWGYRHTLFLVMGIVLFIIQVIDIIIYVNKSNQIVEKNGYEYYKK